MAAPPDAALAAAATTLAVLSGGAMRGVLERAVPLFEQAGPAKVDVRFDLTASLVKDIAAGGRFDVALLPRPEIDGLVERRRIAPESATDIARSAIGVAVRAGAPKPEIGSVAAFIRMLHAARSITYSDGPSGLYIADLLARLGLAEVLRPKTRLTTGPVAELVARGEAEIGLQQIVAILPVEGAELVGPLPAELQNIIVYAAGQPAGRRPNPAADALVAFLRGPAAQAIIRAAGMEPA